MKVIKKDKSIVDYDEQKIIDACNKAAYRAITVLDSEDYSNICKRVWEIIEEEDFENDLITVTELHAIVEKTLMELFPAVGESYRQYRNYKNDFVKMLDEVYAQSQKIMYLGDKDNANTDSALVSTKRSLIFNQLNKELYQKFFMTTEEIQACRDGYLYVHDMSARRDTMNCCIFDVETVLSGGFEMGNVWYNEPKTLDTAFDVIGDIVLSAASQQYGGFTVPEVDKILGKYAEMSYQKYLNKYISLNVDPIISEKQALEDVKRDMEQGYQGWEYKFNTVASSRGDYPFITITFGLGTLKFEKMASMTFLKVRAKGQGKKDHKKPVLFPKLVFLYTEELHGVGKVNEELFEEGITTSMTTMYPDWLSLDGNTVLANMYHKYGKVISPMGCRAFLSPYYKNGGFEPLDETDEPYFVGRFNIGAVSLHLPMILAKSKQENKDFYEVLDYYLELIRNLHIRTYEYLGNMKASTNPLAYCEGGFYGGHLKSNDKIKPLLKQATASFGITALNELQQLYNGKSLVEDGKFAIDVLTYINQKIKQFKEEDHNLYAIYGTPAESLCFSGETEIQCYDKNKMIKDIVPGDLVYSFNESKSKIELKKVISSCLTKQNAVVVKVTFDNGQEIICTPEHPIAVRVTNQDIVNGRILGESIEYTKAINLKKGDRIKSNYIHLNTSERPECSIYHNGIRQLIQDINAEYYYGEKPIGYVTHHKNHNKQNNSFENLEYITDAEHRIYHLKDTIQKYQHTSESQTGKNNSFYGRSHTDETLLKNRLAHIGKSVDVFDVNNNFIKHYECIEDAVKEGFTRSMIKTACESAKHLYRSLLWYYSQDVNISYDKNHKVSNVEIMDSLVDVYNIEVEDNNNYFVGGEDGVLVHNCGLQIQQFRQKYGIIENVSDREYISNSFHCHVTEDITPIQKQDLEHRFWNLSEGGRIQYVKYPINYNRTAVKTLIRRAMEMGLYEGVNLSLSYCDDCGHQELDMDCCPVCGSTNLTKIDRMNGYLSYSRVHGDTRLNAAKMAEIAERKSM